MSEPRWTKNWEKLEGAAVDDDGNFTPLEDDIVIVTGSSGDGAEWDFSGEITVKGEGAVHNAALISAAPDLYAALIEVREWIDAQSWTHNFNCDRAFEIIDAALAKARGEQP